MSEPESCPYCGSRDLDEVITDLEEFVEEGGLVVPGDSGPFKEVVCNDCGREIPNQKLDDEDSGEQRDE